MTKLGFRIGILILVVGVAGSGLKISAQSKKDLNQARQLLEAGDKSFNAKDYRDAADKYGQALTLVPTNPYGHYKNGFAHFNLKENDQAISEFALALTQGYKPPLDIYRVRAYIYYDQKNWDATLDDTKKVLALSPNDLQFLRELGEIYLVKDSYPEAIDALKKAVVAAPDDADIQYDLSRVYFATGDAKSQQAAAEAALAKGTHFPGEAFYLLGDADQKQHNSDGAIDAYKRAIAAKPDVHDTYRILSEVYRSAGRYNDAIAISKQGLRAFPNDGAFYTDLSWYYGLADRPTDAVEAGKAAVQILPQQAAGYTNLCRAYNDIKSYDLAMFACNNALRLNPGDGETYFYLGRAYNLTGKNAEATKYYALAVKGLEDAATKTPDSSEVLYLLGNAYFADKQIDKAIDAYVKCIAISSRFVKARYNLGIMYTLKKDKANATEQYNALAALDQKLADDLKSKIDKM